MIALARFFSVVGHPALLMPAAVAGAAMARDAGPSVLWAATGASLVAGLAVAIFSLMRVRAGGWQHVDASVPSERKELNRFLVPLLGGLALALALSGQPRSIVLGMALGAVIVICAQAFRSQMKMSLHMAFAVLAALLLWPWIWAVALLLLLSVGVGWSRIALQRHTGAEVVVGGLVGCAAGVFWVVLSA